MSRKFVVAIGATVLVLAGTLLTGSQPAFSGVEDAQSNSRDIAFAEMLQRNLATVIEVRKARIANAEIWIKGNSSEELTPVEQEIYAELVYMQNDLNWFFQAQQKALGNDEWKEIAEADLAAFLYKSPRARSLWNAREERLTTHRTLIRPDFASSWQDRVEAAISVFEQAAETEE